MISVVNRAYGELLRVPPDILVGQPAERMLREHIKPRFRDPTPTRRSPCGCESAPIRRCATSWRTIDGLVLERFSAPVRDSSGTLLGRGRDPVRHHRPPPRPARGPRARGGERRPARAGGSGARRRRSRIARGAHMLASALTRTDIHDQLVQQASRSSARRRWRCSRCAAGVTSPWPRLPGSPGRRCAACAGGEATVCSHGSSIPDAPTSAPTPMTTPGSTCPSSSRRRSARSSPCRSSSRTACTAC